MISQIKQSFNEDSLKAIYIFANTSLYLYNRLRDNQTIKTISQKYSTDALLKVFFSILPNKKKHVKQFSSIVCIYSLIACLSLKQYKEVESFFKRLPAYRIEWAQEISDIFLAFSTSETQITIKHHYQLPKDFNAMVKNNNPVEFKTSENRKDTNDKNKNYFTC
jgi:hypothetical protein